MVKSSPGRRRLARKGAPPRGGKTVSKQQQKLFFARGYSFAHRVARRGADYQRLPTRKHPPKAGSAR